jgi:hypothetical protein
MELIDFVGPGMQFSGMPGIYVGEGVNAHPAVPPRSGDRRGSRRPPLGFLIRPFWA